MKWTIKRVTANIMMVTGATTAVTGAIKQIIELFGCTAKKAALVRYEYSPHPPPPPPPSPPPGFDATPFYGLILLVIGVVIYLVARRIRRADV